MSRWLKQPCQLTPGLRFVVFGSPLARRGCTLRYGPRLQRSELYE